ncbi:PfkB family carbohydrate kinase [Inquilinus sp. YAF38]|uniref:PfkB family carbohydrate kinase n=1 Tax=Inquilinus sp. YAF38 TaxID=3233084 RepID=UPI003F8EA011
MPEPKVIVVGSLHYDIMVSAPDRPRRGETVLGDAWWPKCGGKGGNQAVEAALAGVRAVMVGAVGDDAFGAALLAHLHRAGVEAGAVAVVPGAASGMSVAVLDAAGDYGAVVVSGVNRAIRLTDEAASDWQPGDWLVLQNEVPAAVNLDAARLAHRRGLHVLLNAAPVLSLETELAAMIDILVVNAIEAEMLSGVAVLDLETASIAAGRLRSTVGTVVVTAGGAGVAYAAPDGSGRVAAVPAMVRSTHGAGDCFIGVLAAALASGLLLEDAIRRGNAAAGRLVSLGDEERDARFVAAGPRRGV